ncbi:MAG: hypothetical protein HN337_06140 [Deltaproteobacteria bacterium]|nr:hypothetical protein [Deltaproteobacteria bacterium]
MEMTCDNGLDDEGDGLIDCEDPDCKMMAPNCMESKNCNDEIDNDLNGYTDCDDAACEYSMDCMYSAGETECEDGIDNDMDGDIDCADEDCAHTEKCAAGTDFVSAALLGDGIVHYSNIHVNDQVDYYYFDGTTGSYAQVLKTESAAGDVLKVYDSDMTTLLGSDSNSCTDGMWYYACVDGTYDNPIYVVVDKSGHGDEGYVYGVWISTGATTCDMILDARCPPK